MSAEENRRRAHRSYDQRIADLEAEILRQKQKLEAKRERTSKKREVSASIKGIPRVAKKLQEFAAVALADKRMDIFNSVSMFLAGLQRMYNEEIASRVDLDEPELDELAERSAPTEVTTTQRLTARDELRPHKPAGGTSRADVGIVRQPRDTSDVQPKSAPATKAELMFDERLRAVAKDGLRKKIDDTSLSEWER